MNHAEYHWLAVQAIASSSIDIDDCGDLCRFAHWLWWTREAPDVESRAIYWASSREFQLDESKCGQAFGGTSLSLFEESSPTDIYHPYGRYDMQSWVCGPVSIGKLTCMSAVALVNVGKI